MNKKLLLFLITTLLFTTGIAQAEPEDVVYFDLSLAGYRLGMTFDEAAEVRPFQYIQDNQENSDDIPAIEAFIDQVYIDEIETNLWLSFRTGEIANIFVRFSPDALEDVSRRFKKTLGKGENRSRAFTNHAGAEIQQTICQWNFPHAKLHLIEISSNTEFATISLVKKRENSKLSAEKSDDK